MNLDKVMTPLSDITTPLIAQVGLEQKIYGPFMNGIEAQEWYERQPKDVRICFMPLRSPNVKRTYNDFYQPVYMENESREFDGELLDVIVESGL